MVRSVTHLPIQTALYGNPNLPRRFFHRSRIFFVQRPRPVDLIVDPCAKIDGVAGQVTALERLAGASVDQRLLARGSA